MTVTPNESENDNEMMVDIIHLFHPRKHRHVHVTALKIDRIDRTRSTGVRFHEFEYYQMFHEYK